MSGRALPAYRGPMSYIALQSFNNRAALARASVAGCYTCLSAFKPEDVTSWTHDDSTAVCPLCDAETVLPGVGDLTALRAAHASLHETAETVPAALSIRPEWL